MHHPHPQRTAAPPQAAACSASPAPSAPPALLHSHESAPSAVPDLPPSCRVWPTLGLWSAPCAAVNCAVVRCAHGLITHTHTSSPWLRYGCNLPAVQTHGQCIAYNEDSRVKHHV
eukprot:scaffold126577_cov24-Tisochrysis_lutea.AAC.1